MNRPVSIGPRPLWSVLVGATGGLTWTQTSFGAGAELLVGVPRHGHAMLCLAAGAVLIAGLWRRSAWTLLLAFPAALLAAFATMTPDALQAAFGPFRWLPWCASATTYLLVTSLWLSDPGAESLGVERRAGDDEAGGRRTAAATYGRIALACALLLVPALSLVYRFPADHVALDPPASLLFAHLALVFAWCVGAYTFFIAPMLDAERERRTMKVELAEGNRRSRVAKGVGFAVVSVILSLLWFGLLSGA